MTDFLEQVVASRREYVREAQTRRSEQQLLDAAPAARSSRAFSRAVQARRNAGRLAVIAEVKRMSPALGELARPSLSAAEQARRYEAAGATAISVLVEPRFWGGSLADLAAVKAAVSIPVLCKDVVVDVYQLAEARSAGADAVLLIAEALTDAELVKLRARAGTLQLETLVEAHESVAFGRAVATGSVLVGINARNLRAPTEIDIGRVRQLHTFAKEGQLLVAESGIATDDDARLLPSRVDAVLVGTALMRADDPAPLIAALAGVRRTGQDERTTITVIER